ncbi:MAG: hypothetical protein QOE14_923 [Humisphaera sp.]|nr:hypothetical protein [Humisphaera sp.]
MPPDEQIDYDSPGDKIRGTGRSATTWAKLFVVWAIGLVSWTLYVIAILYLWMRFL